MGKALSKLGGVFHDFKTYWNTPPEGKHVPYKEYLYIFGAVGGDYTLKYLTGFLSFSTGCYLVAEECLSHCGIYDELAADPALRDLPSKGMDLGSGFIQHGAVPQLLKRAGLDPEGIAKAAMELLEQTRSGQAPLV